MFEFPNVRSLIRPFAVALMLLAGAAGPLVAQPSCRVAPGGETGPGGAMIVAQDDHFGFPAAAMSFDVLANDSSPSGSPISIVGAGPATGGTVSIAPNGLSVTFTPGAGTTRGSFPYSIRDTEGHTASATVTLWQDAVPVTRITDFEVTCQGNECIFYEKPATPNGIRLHTWTFGDGTQLSGGYSTAFHQYGANNGTWMVTLRLDYFDGSVAQVVKPVMLSTAAPSILYRIAQSGRAIVLRMNPDDNDFLRRTGEHIYRVDWGDGSVSTIIPTIWDEFLKDHLYRSVGTYLVEVYCYEWSGDPNDQGRTYYFDRSIEVGNLTPRVSLQAVETPASVPHAWFFSTTVEQDDSPPSVLKAKYDFGDGTIIDDHPVQTPILHAYAKPGQYVATLVVTDDLSAQGVSTKTITVSNDPPLPKIGFTCRGLTCDFDATASTDDEETITSYRWNFGNGVIVDGATASRTFAAAGCVPITLTTTDERGASRTASKTLTLSTTPLSPGKEALIVDARANPSSTILDLNGIAEPNEWVIVEPEWRNNGPGGPYLGKLTTTADPFNLQIRDDTADYGLLNTGATADCSQTGNCYSVRVSSQQHAGSHYDLPLTETINGSGRSWSLHVGETFADIPRDHWAYAAIESLVHRGVTLGCGTGRYCPDGIVAGDSMAVFVVRAISTSEPPACAVAPFNDVPCSHWAAPFIAELKRRNLTADCGNGNFCPSSPVTRATMAIILARAINGTSWTPPACVTAPFTDVPCSDPAAPHIAEIKRRNVSNGCGDNKYCPTGTVSRDQMAVFLTRAFDLSIAFPLCPARVPGGGTASMEALVEADASEGGRQVVDEIVEPSQVALPVPEVKP